MVPTLSLSQWNRTLLVLVVDVPASVRLVPPLTTPTPPRSEEVGGCALWIGAGWRFGISFGMAPAVLSPLGIFTLIASGLPGEDGGSKASSVSEVFGEAACPNVPRSLVATCAMGSQRRGDCGFFIVAAGRIRKSLSAFLAGE